MRVGLVADTYNFPNIPLMKISGWHKSKRDWVEFLDQSKHYDRVYVSKVFTESQIPTITNASEIVRGGSGYDLKNKLPYEIEHFYPDYSLYPELTKEIAYGMLTRGCPRCNHSFCITPQKDGRTSRKAADLKEFWNGQKTIMLLDQNLLACKDRLELLDQLKNSKSKITFNGGLDIRFFDSEIIEIFREINVKGYYFAWDDPKENLRPYFEQFKASNLKQLDTVNVYVLVNYWSTVEQDLKRIYILRNLGYMPYVMVYDKQKYVDNNGFWLKGVGDKYSNEVLVHFKTCQFMQRWCNNRRFIKSVPDFRDYRPYREWVKNGQQITNQISTNQMSIF